MKKAVIYYNSRKGTTKYFAEEICEFLSQNNITALVYSIYDLKPEQIVSADYVLLGSWTSGLFIAFQHPDQEFGYFTDKLPDLKDKRIGLFTTYKLATGNFFKKMESHLSGKIKSVGVTLKSKSYKLTEEHKSLLLDFIR